MSLILKSFSELSGDELYAVLKLRQDVFVLEQQSLYGDLDDLDQVSLHLLWGQPSEMAAYLRLREEQGQCVKIERVVTAAHARGRGLAGQLMDRALSEAHQRWPELPVRLSAQVEVIEFYRRRGFVVCSDPYDDGGIDHVDMVLAD
ncbi:GNAT family N-acetyltransferase [Aestuariibacter halophilus]|uniref:GNAT family N-acetyltransferase n=1 Tax=Fluctibacter halophilus TaxID=226011 RepID=A0ABS8G8I3_9ALTE|nr:GNAT family N-acetyltransferase [Aestuariibacter halophilus]MCC2616850.1 GNAT family N-acetyltransferase [Aestuariibacter halophilus]